MYIYNLSIYPSIYPPIYLSIYLSIYRVTRAHTHTELIRERLWEPKGSSLEYI